MLTELRLSPDELRVILDCLSRTIYHAKESGRDRGEPEVDEAIQVYRKLHAVVDKQYPDFLYTNSFIKEWVK